jgi:dihydroorotase
MILHSNGHTRRRFLERISIGSTLICTVVDGWRNVLGNPQKVDGRYDLLVKGGRVIDPSQSLSGEYDVAILDGKIAKVEKTIPVTEAQQVLNAKGRIVTPGLVDIHVHVYDSVTPIGIPPDPNCIAKGVTTAVDAGSAGAHTFPGFRRHIINVADTRIFALLNISVIGLASHSFENQHGELLDLRYVNTKLALQTIERNRDVILGVKIRMSRNLTDANDLKALQLAREVCDAAHLPLMVHIGGSYSPLPDILALLKKGDVVTHCFRAGEGGILDSNGKVLQEVRKAVERGVHLDVGHGVGAFSFDVAEMALRQDVVPGTISSDLHQLNVNGPVFDLATTLSKFIHLGFTLEQVLQRATSNPAHTFGFPQGLGSLRQGAIADVAVFNLDEGDFEFRDAEGQQRIGHQKLVPVATVKAGRIYGSASVPLVRADQ